jgi:hypothetical protein
MELVVIMYWLQVNCMHGILNSLLMILNFFFDIVSFSGGIKLFCSFLGQSRQYRL